MKPRLMLLGLALPLLLAAQQDKPLPELKEFVSKDGGFKVLLPGTPRKEEKKSKGPKDQEITTNLFVVGDKSTAFVAAYMVIPELLKKDAETVKNALVNIKAGVETGMNAKLTKEEKVAMAGTQGIEYRFEVPGGLHYRLRACIVQDKLYQVAVLGPKEVTDSKGADKMLDSLELLKP